jgi:hypothetical protein
MLSSFWRTDLKQWTVAALIVALLTVSGCATAPVDKDEPRRVVGSEERVRVDAQVFAQRLSANEVVSIAYEIVNGRDEAIAVADLLPSTSYDAESRTLTVEIGSEVPGNEFIPRLQKVASGETKAFTVGARMPALQGTERLGNVPRYLRIRIYFLGDVKPFETLVGIPERAIRDTALADQLFPQWVDNTESVVTNAIPIQWNSAAAADVPAARRRRI